MPLPAFADPNLSQLMEPGNQRIAQIQQGAQAQQGLFAQVPGIFDRYDQARTAQSAENRNNRPVTPWEKAAARLLAGHPPKDVANELKGHIATGAAQMPGADQSAPGQPGVSGPPGIAQQAQGPQQAMGGQGAPTDDGIFNGMNHQDWGDYINALEKGRLAQANNRPAPLSLEDQLTLIRAKGEAPKAVAEIGAGAKRDVANTNAGAKQQTTEERINQRKDEMKQKLGEHQDNLRLGYAKIQAYSRIAEERNRQAGKKDAILDALVKQLGQTMGAAKTITGSDTYYIDDSAKKRADELFAKSNELEAAIRAHIESNPIQPAQTQESSKTVQTKKGSAGASPETPPIPAKSAAPKYKVGDEVMYKGQKKVIKSIDANGNVKFNE